MSGRLTDEGRKIVLRVPGYTWTVNAWKRAAQFYEIAVIVGTRDKDKKGVC
jgi:hypothetical protein